MKRSKMVQIFDSSYQEWEYDTGLWEKFDSYGEYLFYLTEEAEMLPPFNIQDFYNDGDNADERMITYRTWEEE